MKFQKVKCLADIRLNVRGEVELLVKWDVPDTVSTWESLKSLNYFGAKNMLSDLAIKLKAHPQKKHFIKKAIQTFPQ